MKMEVPEDEILFFDLRKWTKVLNLSYAGDDREAFEKELERQGIKDALDIFAKPFYPLLKRKIVNSWEQIFEIENMDKQYLQGAVWCIKREWIKEVKVL